MNKNLKQMLKHNVETNEKLRDEKQTELKGYQDGWGKIHQDLQDKIQKAYQYTTDIEMKLTELSSEKEKTQLEYEQKAKEIQEETKEKQETNQLILDKTAWDLDKFNAKKIMKEKERQVILEKMEDVNKKIRECKHNVDIIKIKKGEKEALLDRKEKFIAKSEEDKKRLAEEVETAREMCARAKQQLQEERAKCDTRIESHNKMKEFFKAGKVTSNRVLEDMSKAASKAMEIAGQESKKQLDYIKEKENNLINSYINKMRNPKMYADRIQLPEAGKEVNKEEQKNIQVKASIYDYMKQLDSMKTFNSKSFNNLKKAVLKQYSENGEFLLNAAGVDHDEKMKNVKENLKEIAERAKAYIQDKGSAKRFTSAGKERYRFADEMRTMAEGMLEQLALWDKEKEDINKLMTMDDSELFVTRSISFYKTESYNMAREAFVKKDELDKMDMLVVGEGLEDDDELEDDELEEKKEEIVGETKEETKEEIKEEKILESDEMEL